MATKHFIASKVMRSVRRGRDTTPAQEAYKEEGKTQNRKAEVTEGIALISKF